MIFKIFFSLLSVVIFIFVCFAKVGYKDSEKRLIGDDISINSSGFDISFWPFVVNKDGTFKRHGKLFILAVFILVNIYMWLTM